MRNFILFYFFPFFFPSHLTKNIKELDECTMNSLCVTANSRNCLQKEKEKNFTHCFTLSNAYKRFQQGSPGANFRNRRRSRKKSS